MRITVKEVAIEKVNKGGRPYENANVVFDYRGENRTRKIISFSNPEVFQVLKGLPRNTEVDVEIGNDQYKSWVKVTPVTDAEEPNHAPAAPNRATNPVRGNFETSEERARRQVLITRQSSLSAAVATLAAGAKAPPKREEVLDLAETYNDWVHENSLETLGQSSGTIERALPE